MVSEVKTIHLLFAANQEKVEHCVKMFPSMETVQFIRIQSTESIWHYFVKFTTIKKEVTENKWLDINWLFLKLKLRLSIKL